MSNLTPRQLSIECYRNLHKDAYGYHDRHSDIDSWSDDKLGEKIAEVAAYGRKVAKQEAMHQDDNWERFKISLAEYIRLGAKTTADAWRWYTQAQDIEGEVSAYGFEYACYHIGCGYHREDELRELVS